MPSSDPHASAPSPRRRLRAPSGRRFAAGAVASVVAVFGVLALRVHDGLDPALASAGSHTTTSGSSSSSATTTDPYASGTSSTDNGAVSSTPPAATSAS
jgi:hypothetical protein